MVRRYTNFPFTFKWRWNWKMEMVLSQEDIEEALGLYPNIYQRILRIYWEIEFSLIRR